MPLFRTLQWSWFLLAMVYSYGESVHHFCQCHGHLVHVTQVTQHLPVLLFSMYCITLISTILTFQCELIRFQLSQLVWTMVTVAMVVLQMKFMADCVLHGLFWFCYPMAVVVSNDVFAYVCGMTCGKKFISAPFLSLSPNKTWEGFLGAAVLTTAFSFTLPLLLADIPWLICPVETFSFVPQELSSVTCTPHDIFLPHLYTAPLFFPLIGGQSVELLPIQLHGILYGLFGSLVAPFGGFLASAIKRGYNIKDFDQIIPGHGGVMDRMDCQLMIHLFAYLHLKFCVGVGSYSTSPSVVGASAVLSAASRLSAADLEWVHRELGALLGRSNMLN